MRRGLGVPLVMLLLAGCVGQTVTPDPGGPATVASQSCSAAPEGANLRIQALNPDNPRAPFVNTTVTIKRMSESTGPEQNLSSDGCAYFSLVAAGDYSAYLDGEPRPGERCRVFAVQPFDWNGTGFLSVQIEAGSLCWGV